MTTKTERNVGLSLIVAGIGAIAFAIISGLTTADGGPDWVGIVTGGAGLVVLVTGLFTAFRSGSTRVA
jgi:hypothetical protein